MHPETKNNNLQYPSKEPETANTTGSALNTLSSAIFYLAILFFIIGFNFSDVMVGNWYQQFFPNIGGRSVTDITFLDSLNGYAVATQTSDTSYIMKTINGGDNWQIVYRNFFAMTKIQFLNVNTGYACGGYLYKTVNGGLNWIQVNTPSITAEEMYVLNQDTIWIIWKESLLGGVYRTTNGGANWEQQLNLGSSNPDHIYMINGRKGFISQTNNYTRITTNSGMNWTILFNGSGQGFYDMYFADSLTGWGNFFETRKTTDGGFNWFSQTMPSGGNIVTSPIQNLAGLNKDTIWGAGAQILTSLGIRGMINRTTDGGNTWLFQVPDSSYNNNIYRYLVFYNKLNGWAYLNSLRGIHTITGGDPIWLTPVQQISTEVPKEYRLYQNYPNPFNPVTNIKYSVKRETSDVKLVVFDITGKEIIILVNQKQSAGTYEVDFSGSNYSSGLYFYSLIIDGKLTDTKKMILLK